MVDPVPAAALRTALALLLATAAWHKLRAPAVFRQTLGDYRLLPPALVPLLSFGVPIIEIGVAVGLLAGAPAAALFAAALFAVYGLAIGVNLARGRRHIDCGCTGPAARQTLSGWLVGRNAALVAAALVAALPVAARAWVWLDVFTAAAAVATLSLVWLAAERLLAEWPELARLRSRA